MAEPFVGEIRMFAGNFAPRNWALCTGQLLAVSQNDVLFSLLGTIYGGDGRTTFGLPDMRGRILVHQGNGPGLSSRQLGAKGGSERQTVSVAQLPSHTHQMLASTDVANTPIPTIKVVARSPSICHWINDPPEVPLNAAAITTKEGGGQEHDNVGPFLCIHYIIALFGGFPPRASPPMASRSQPSEAASRV